jgi:hypothetical protein
LLRKNNYEGNKDVNQDINTFDYKITRNDYDQKTNLQKFLDYKKDKFSTSSTINNYSK